MAIDVNLDGAGRRLLADADAVSSASKESIGSDAIIMSSCSGACRGDWDGDVPRVEGVSMASKWRQWVECMLYIQGVCVAFLHCKLRDLVGVAHLGLFSVLYRCVTLVVLCEDVDC